MPAYCTFNTIGTLHRGCGRGIRAASLFYTTGWRATTAYLRNTASLWYVAAAKMRYLLWVQYAICQAPPYISICGARPPWPCAWRPLMRRRGVNGSGWMYGWIALSQVQIWIQKIWPEKQAPPGKCGNDVCSRTWAGVVGWYTCWGGVFGVYLSSSVRWNWRRMEVSEFREACWMMDRY